MASPTATPIGFGLSALVMAPPNVHMTRAAWAGLTALVVNVTAMARMNEAART